MPDDLSMADPAGARPAGEFPLMEEPAQRKQPALADKADDLEALRTAVVDAAGVSTGFWLSYLFVLFYLLIATGGVTHRDLFFASPVKLPFLNVDLPLEGFFALGPALFLIVHAYVLLHFVLLASKIGAFDAQLRAQIDDDEVRARLRRQLPINIFVQFLAGPREVRRGPMGFLLRLIAWISLVVGPIALLVFFQLQFLPYHDEWITWWQRIAVVIDLALLWGLWPAVVGGEAIRPPAWGSMGWRTDAMLACLILVSLPLVFTIATFPGEWLETWQRAIAVLDLALLWLLWPAVGGGKAIRPAWRSIGWGTASVLGCLSLVSLPLVFTIATFPGEWLESKLPSTPLREFLVAGEVDFEARKPKSWWSNRLVLPGLDVIDRAKLDSEMKIAAISETISLRKRHLEGAVLIGAVLRKADLTGAELQGARLWGAQLQGVKLDGAQLTRANFEIAQLQGASLDGAQLQGAGLSRAYLQGASLKDAQLQGASLDFAQLQGAKLDGAQFQGASLLRTNLQGASLERAHLQGASLRLAELQGASLDGAQLQGASFRAAHLQGASLRSAFVWRADARRANTIGVYGDDLAIGPKQSCNGLIITPCDGSAGWSGEVLSRLKQSIEQVVPAGERRTQALATLDLRLAPEKPLDGEDEMARKWSDVQRSSPAPAAYEAELAKHWRQIGCATEGAPFVLTRLIWRMVSTSDKPLAKDSPRASQLAADFLKEDCAGTRRLPDEMKEKLLKLRDGVP